MSAGPAAGRERFPAADWLGWREALDQILSRCEALPTERVEASGVLGAAVAEDVKAAVFHPPWDNSAMDGFAVHAEDVRGATADSPITLPVSDDIPAGCFPSGPLPRGTVARVMTGAPVPEPTPVACLHWPFRLTLRSHTGYTLSGFCPRMKPAVLGGRGWTMCRVSKPRATISERAECYLQARVAPDNSTSQHRSSPANVFRRAKDVAGSICDQA